MTAVMIITALRPVEPLTALRVYISIKRLKVEITPHTTDVVHMVATAGWGKKQNKENKLKSQFEQMHGFVDITVTFS